MPLPDRRVGGYSPAGCLELDPLAGEQPLEPAIEAGPGDGVGRRQDVPQHRADRLGAAPVLFGAGLEVAAEGAGEDQERQDHVVGVAAGADHRFGEQVDRQQEVGQGAGDQPAGLLRHLLVERQAGEQHEDVGRQEQRLGHRAAEPSAAALDRGENALAQAVVEAQETGAGEGVRGRLVRSRVRFLAVGRVVHDARQITASPGLSPVPGTVGSRVDPLPNRHPARSAPPVAAELAQELLPARRKRWSIC